MVLLKDIILVFFFRILDLKIMFGSVVFVMPGDIEDIGFKKKLTDIGFNFISFIRIFGYMIDN